MTDRELNIAVAKLLAYDKNEHFLIGADGKSPGFIFNKTWYPFDPANSWQHAGPLLEMMPSATLNKDGFNWECWAYFNNGDSACGYSKLSATDAICRAFLRWMKLDPIGFKKATGQS